MKKTKHGIHPLPQGRKWPGGSYIEAAQVRISRDQLQKVLCQVLYEGEEPGLGPWVATGMQLSNGAVIELISYSAEADDLFTLRVDASSDLKSTADEIFATLGLGEREILWVNPHG